MKALISAIEPSSSKYFKEIKHLLPNINFCGIASEDTLSSSIYPLEEFSIMGFSSIIPKIFFLKKAINEMATLATNCDFVLIIDAPSFNLRLAKKIKDKHPNKKIFYFILPKIWAWKKNRKIEVEKYCDHHISILPFEKKFYPNCEYFGNPLAYEYKKNNISFKDNKYIAFMAGSRKSEIKKLMPVFKELKNKLNKKCLLVIPSIFSTEYINKNYGNLEEFTISNNTKEALEKSSFAFVCSGTATLEASLIGVPFVLAYSPSWLDYFIYKYILGLNGKQGLAKIGFIGLANIISYFANQKPIHKEVFPQVTKEALLDIYNNYNYDDYFTQIKQLRKLLEQDNKDCLALVANFIDKKTNE